jgi:hypothetical protein
MAEAIDEFLFHTLPIPTTAARADTSFAATLLDGYDQAKSGLTASPQR